jgi:hypothetical protein
MDRGDPNDGERQVEFTQQATLDHRRRANWKSLKLLSQKPVN